MIKKQKLQKLSIGTLEGYKLIDYSTILYLQANGGYTTLFLTDRSQIVISKSLGVFEKELSNELFLRIHNSFLVNLNKIKEYKKADGGHIVLTNNKSLPVSRSRKPTLLKLFI